MSPSQPQPSARPGDRIARAFVSGTAWIGAGSALQGVLRLAMIAVLSKHFAPALYGYWAVLATTADIVAPIAALGLTYGYMRRHAGGEDRGLAHRSFLGVVLVVAVSGAVFSGLLAALSGAFSGWFMGGSELGRQVVVAGSLLLLFTALEFLLRFYFGTELRMGRRVLLATGRFAMEVAAVVAGVESGFGLVGVVALIVAARAVPALVALGGILWRRGLARPAFGAVPAGVRYGLPLQLGVSAGILMRLSDRYVLGAVGTSAQMGAYAAAYDIASFLLLASVTLEHGLFPVLAALFNRGEEARALWMYALSVKYYLVAAVPCAAVLTAAGRPVLVLVTTPEYADIGAVAMPWIAWGAVCYGLAIVARCLLGVAHRTVATMVATWLTTVAKLAALVALVLWLGVLGAGLATFATFLALMVVFLVMTRPVFAAHREAGEGPPVSARALVGLAVAGGVAAVPLWLLAAPSLGRLLIGLAAYGAVYVAALFALGVVRVGELRSAWRLMARSRTSPLPAEETACEEGDAAGL
ncbi:MAG: lipopolysaccharide biosynthesis protein [Candidatus Brocadiia bacterium]